MLKKMTATPGSIRIASPRLNVRAIIHNSDYKSVDEAKTAIDRYFTERNTYFREHPRRAGKKLWGKEREPAVFSEASNCKDPRYR